MQGVGFRWNVREESSEFDVAGYVKNLSDGSVEMLAEGEKDEVNRCLASVENRMRSYVTDRTTLERMGDGQFSGFGITC